MYGDTIRYDTIEEINVEMGWGGDGKNSWRRGGNGADFQYACLSLMST